MVSVFVIKTLEVDYYCLESYVFAFVVETILLFTDMYVYTRETIYLVSQILWVKFSRTYETS